MFEQLLLELARRGIRLYYLSQRDGDDPCAPGPWICCVANELGNGWSRGDTAIAAIREALNSYRLYPQPQRTVERQFASLTDLDAL